MIFSCNKSEINKEDEIQNSIKNLLFKFPQLHSEKNSKYYLKKSIFNGDSNTEIRLYSEPSDIDDPQKILVFIANKKVYSIPFFSNTFRDYYEFPFDEKLSEFENTNTTFTKELNNAIDYTELNTDNYIGFETIIDLTSTLLNAPLLEVKDTTDLKIIFWNNVKRLEYEPEIKVSKRLKNNYEIISKNLDSVYTVLDKHNYRIYQFYNTQSNPKMKAIFNIKSYRQDQIVHFLNL